MQIAELWRKRPSARAAAAALLGVKCCSHTDIRFWHFLPKHGITWLERNFYPPGWMDMFDKRVNDYNYCVRTLAEGAKVAEIINQQQHDPSCANTGLREYTPPKKVEQLAATIKKLNKLDDEDRYAFVNDHGVLEMPFDPALLNSRTHLFHVRRCSAKHSAFNCSAKSTLHLFALHLQVRAGHVSEKRWTYHGRAFL